MPRLMGAPLNSTDDDDATVNRAIFGELDGGDSVNRQAIAKEDLMMRLTKMIQSCEGCESVSVVGVTRLDFPDKDGRNWSRSLVLDAAGVPAEVYSLAYASVIGTAHDTWNLK
jgi:hypothetical protein